MSTTEKIVLIDVRKQLAELGLSSSAELLAHVCDPSTDKEADGVSGERSFAAHEHEASAASAMHSHQADDESLTATDADDVDSNDAVCLNPTSEEQLDLTSPDIREGPPAETDEDQQPKIDEPNPSNSTDSLPAVGEETHKWEPDLDPEGTLRDCLTPQELYHLEVCEADEVSFFPIEGIEPLHHYRPEGFHPAYIGEEFCDGRYRIVHKLGYGTTSTVWLAADNAEGKWVALKILMAFASKDSRESEALHALQAGNPKHMGRTFVTTFLDEFFIDGPNGRHRCLVSEPACPSIEVAVHEAYLGVNKARSIAAQALLALSYIHSCGVVHGDLHTGNILYHDPKSAGGGIAIDKLYERVGEPELVPVLENGEQPVVKSLPRFWVHDTCFCGFEGVKLLQVQIHDFGASSLVGNQNTRSLAPMVLRPPEVMFDEEITQASDMWTFGCTMYEILGRWCLFEGEGMFQLRDTDNDDILVQMVECFGKLPERWMERWEEKDNWFLPNGEWRTGKMTKHRKYLPKPFRTFSERFAEMLDRYNRDEGVIEAEEAACLEKLLRAMFALEPAERITAEEAVNSEWMQRWGLPAMYEKIPETRPSKQTEGSDRSSARDEVSGSSSVEEAGSGDVSGEKDGSRNVNNEESSTGSETPPPSACSGSSDSGSGSSKPGSGSSKSDSGSSKSEKSSGLGSHDVPAGPGEQWRNYKQDGQATTAEKALRQCEGTGSDYEKGSGESVGEAK